MFYGKSETTACQSESLNKETARPASVSGKARGSHLDHINPASPFDRTKSTVHPQVPPIPSGSGFPVVKGDAMSPSNCYDPVVIASPTRGSHDPLHNLPNGVLSQTPKPKNLTTSLFPFRCHPVSVLSFLARLSCSRPKDRSQAHSGQLKPASQYFTAKRMTLSIESRGSVDCVPR